MKQLGFGLVGCGMIANFHAEALKRIRGTKLVACYDTIPASADRYAAANPGAGANAEDIQSTTINTITVDTLDNGLKQLSFYTTYNTQALPEDYRKFLGTKTAEGYVIVQFDPNEDAQQHKNVITQVTVTLPEPGTAMLGMAGLALGMRRRRVGVRG